MLSLILLVQRRVYNPLPIKKLCNNRLNHRHISDARPKRLVKHMGDAVATSLYLIIVGNDSNKCDVFTEPRINILIGAVNLRATRPQIHLIHADEGAVAANIPDIPVWYFSCWRQRTELLERQHNAGSVAYRQRTQIIGNNLIKNTAPNGCLCSWRAT